MSKYFKRFPLVNYDGAPAKNIMSRVDFTDKAKKDIYSNFDFVLTDDNRRPDVLSYNYYESPMYDWLLYMSNDVIDPYYDWHMDTQSFNQYIEKKYGSASSARNTILFYRNDWSVDDSLIEGDVYDSLDASIKKYWTPKINANGYVQGYERVKEDWTVSTNMIAKLQMTDAVSVSAFNVGDVINQAITSSRGSIISIDSVNNTLTIQHVEGGFEPDSYIESITVLVQNIADAEAPFWSPVNAYEYEEEKNELKRYINLIKKTYLSDVEKKFAEQINS